MDRTGAREEGGMEEGLDKGGRGGAEAGGARYTLDIIARGPISVTIYRNHNYR